MAEPPPRDPRDPAEDETVVVPADEQTVVAEEWGPESEVFVEEQTETVPPRRRMPVIWPWLLALLLLVLGGLGAYYFLSQDDDDDDAATTTTIAIAQVPVLVGLREERAEERIREAGYESEVDRKASAKPRGVVFAQDPEAGTDLERGETVSITVSTGPPRETVPDVVGQPVDEAVEDLRAVGLGSERVEAFAEQEQGTVVKQDPEGGAKLRKGGVVKLTISKGPQPISVPDVVGTTSSQATETLRDAGFEVNLVAVPSDEAAGTVLAQNPSAGTEAPKGTAVRLNVAQAPGETTPPPATTGGGGGGTTTAPPATTRPATTQAQAQRTTVPDAVGKELAPAAREFARAGLKVAVAYVPSEEQAGRVIAQAQPAGTERNRGDTVQLNVSTGAEPAEAASVPDVVGDRQEQGRRTLEQAGFEVLALALEGQVRRESVVASQSPGGGASVARGSLVLLYVNP